MNGTERIWHVLNALYGHLDKIEEEIYTEFDLNLLDRYYLSILLSLLCERDAYLSPKEEEGKPKKLDYATGLWK